MWNQRKYTSNLGLFANVAAEIIAPRVRKRVEMKLKPSAQRVKVTSASFVARPVSRLAADVHTDSDVTVWILSSCKASY